MMESTHAHIVQPALAAGRMPLHLTDPTLSRRAAAGFLLALHRNGDAPLPAEEVDRLEELLEIAPDAVASVPWMPACPVFAYPGITHAEYMQRVVQAYSYILPAHTATHLHHNAEVHGLLRGYGLKHPTVVAELLDLSSDGLRIMLTITCPGLEPGALLQQYWPHVKARYPAIADLLVQNFAHWLGTSVCVEQAFSAVANYIHPNSTATAIREFVFHQISTQGRIKREEMEPVLEAEAAEAAAGQVDAAQPAPTLQPPTGPPTPPEEEEEEEEDGVSVVSDDARAVPTLPQEQGSASAPLLPHSVSQAATARAVAQSAARAAFQSKRRRAIRNLSRTNRGRFMMLTNMTQRQQIQLGRLKTRRLPSVRALRGRGRRKKDVETSVKHFVQESEANMRPLRKCVNPVSLLATAVQLDTAVRNRELTLGRTLRESLYDIAKRRSWCVASQRAYLIARTAPDAQQRATIMKARKNVSDNADAAGTIQDLLVTFWETHNFDADMAALDATQFQGGAPAGDEAEPAADEIAEADEPAIPVHVAAGAGVLVPPAVPVIAAVAIIAAPEVVVTSSSSAAPVRRSNRRTRGR
jgi:hypothetical protein